jgi:DNA-binding NtrC family response regulator
MHRLFDRVAAGVFDEALFYRLNTWHIVLDEQ